MSKINKKAVIAFVMGIVLICTATGCSQKKKSRDDILRVGIVTYTQDDPFINAMVEKVKEDLKAMESDDMKIIVSGRNGDDDQRNQNELVEEMIEMYKDLKEIR